MHANQDTEVHAFKLAVKVRTAIPRHQTKTVWKRRQRIESDGLLAAFEGAVGDRDITLSVGDACFVPAPEADWLVEAMTSALT